MPCKRLHVVQIWHSRHSVQIRTRPYHSLLWQHSMESYIWHRFARKLSFIEIAKNLNIVVKTAHKGRSRFVHTGEVSTKKLVDYWELLIIWNSLIYIWKHATHTYLTQLELKHWMPPSAEVWENMASLRRKRDRLHCKSTSRIQTRGVLHLSIIVNQQLIGKRLSSMAAISVEGVLTADFTHDSMNVESFYEFTGGSHITSIWWAKPKVSHNHGQLLNPSRRLHSTGFSWCKCTSPFSTTL